MGHKCCTGHEMFNLYVLNCVTIGVHVVNAIAAALVPTHGGVFVLTYQVLHRGPGGRFDGWSTSATNTTLNLQVMIVSFFMLSALFQCVAVLYRPYRYRDRFKDWQSPRNSLLKKCQCEGNQSLLRLHSKGAVVHLAHWLRYVEYSFSASIMLVGIAMVTGIVDIRELWCIAVLCAATQWFGLLAERVMDPQRMMPAYIAHTAGWFTFLSAYGTILSHYVADKRALAVDSRSIPWYVDFIVITMALLFGGFGIVQFMQIVTPTRMNAYRAEVTNLVLSAVAKTLLGWIVLGVALRPT
jgi:hypothetical protein